MHLRAHQHHWLLWGFFCSCFCVTARKHHILISASKISLYPSFEKPENSVSKHLILVSDLCWLHVPAWLQCDTQLSLLSSPMTGTKVDQPKSTVRCWYLIEFSPVQAKAASFSIATIQQSKLQTGCVVVTMVTLNSRHSGANSPQLLVTGILVSIM